jgi:hypothetical protein
LLKPPKRGRTKEFALAGNSLQNALRRSTEFGPDRDQDVRAIDQSCPCRFLCNAALAIARFERRASRAACSSIRHMCCALSFGRQL